MNSRAAVIFGTIVVIAYVFGVVALYVFFLGGLPFSSSNPEPWGQLGDYFGGMLNPLFALLNVVVVAYIALSVQKLGDEQRKHEQESERRIQTSLDLHREWNSNVIYDARTRAYDLVREYPSKSILELETLVTSERAANFWIVIGFFQRMALLVEHDKVHRQMTLELFSELFTWWWVASFEKQLMRDEIDARDRIRKLKDWFYEHTTASQRAPWIERAKKDLAQALENEGSPQIVG